MIDHAPAREAVILRFLLESGARASEVLALTAGGLRRAWNPKIGIDVTALVRNKGEHSENKAIWCSAETRDQLRRYIARERSKIDPDVLWLHVDTFPEGAPLIIGVRRSGSSPGRPSAYGGGRRTTPTTLERRSTRDPGLD